MIFISENNISYTDEVIGDLVLLFIAMSKEMGCDRSEFISMMTEIVNSLNDDEIYEAGLKVIQTVQ